MKRAKTQLVFIDQQGNAKTVDGLLELALKHAATSTKITTEAHDRWMASMADVPCSKKRSALLTSNNLQGVWDILTDTLGINTCDTCGDFVVSDHVTWDYTGIYCRKCVTTRSGFEEPKCFDCGDAADTWTFGTPTLCKACINK